jgi:hypothetical protein
MLSGKQKPFIDKKGSLQRLYHGKIWRKIPSHLLSGGPLYQPVANQRKSILRQSPKDTRFQLPITGYMIRVDRATILAEGT